MKKNLLIVILFFTTLLRANFIFAQQQIINKSFLPNDIVKQKIAFIDSVRKADGFKREKQLQDDIFYKSLTEQGFSRRYADSLRHFNDPSFIIRESEPSSVVHYTDFFKRINSINSNSSNERQDPVVTPFVTGPEQDCFNGIPVCQQTYTQTNSYSGVGTVQEVNGTCLGSNEKNSVWYIFTVQSAGSFGFDLVTTFDYDYALYDLDAIGGCSKVSSATPIRCNYSATPGKTGIGAPGSVTTNTVTAAELPAIGIPASGVPYENGITTVATGTTYALLVSNYTGDGTGYTLNFTGSASIYDVTAPGFNGNLNYCNGTIRVYFTKLVQCPSIDADGSDFTVSPAGFTIASAVGAGCTSSNFTSQLVLSLTGTPAPGTYTVGVKNGTHPVGNTILSTCGVGLPTSATFTFAFLGSPVVSVSPATICSGSSCTLSVPNITGATYAWSPSSGLGSPSSYSTTATPNATTVYQCAITLGPCSATSTGTATISPIPIASINPTNVIICAPPTELKASGAIGATPFTYNWSNGTTNATATGLGAGVYTCTVISAAGCKSAAATSTVTVTSSGSIGCNIFYASPLGNGDGLSSDNPTSLGTALTLGQCGSIIKLTVGTYSVTDALTVNSNTTLEGGYNSDYTTKTSDMSGGANSTTLWRTNDPDGGAGTIVTCFTVPGGSSGFRFQDLRIEMPGAASTGATNTDTNPTGGSQTNYGIYIGNNCSSYNIVRCYIDGGKGSN